MALAVFGVVRSPRLFALAFLLLTAVLSAVAWMSWDPASVHGSVLRGRTPYSGSLLFLAGAFYWLMLSSWRTEYLAALPIAYATIWLGLQDPKKLSFIAGADYSYGMYL